MARSDDLVTLLTGATASAAPVVTTEALGKKRPFYADEALVLLRSTAGSGAMTAIAYLWGWNEADDRWHYIRALNNGNAIAIPTGVVTYLTHSEIVTGVGKFSRFYCQLGTLGGTATAVTVAMDFVRPGAHD